MIGSDWRVDDRSTTILMNAMHLELAKKTSADRALKLAQERMQQFTASEITERLRGWLTRYGSELIEADRAYVSKKLDELAAKGEERVFRHPVYWGSFTTNVAAFPLIRVAMA